MRWWPRTIRLQLLLGLVLLEALSIIVFAAAVLSFQGQEVRQHVIQRLSHESESVALEAKEAYLLKRPDLVIPLLDTMGQAPSVSRAKITDQNGKVLFVSYGDPAQVALSSTERGQIAKAMGEAVVFSNGGYRWEVVNPIYTGLDLRGFAWVENDPAWDRQQLRTVLRGTLIFGISWIGSSVLLMLLMTRGISQPLALLHRGTRALMESPEAGGGSFPLPVTVKNEFGELIEAFNRMVASIDEQRSGLNDTLSLLDSMLANAPIGLVFFDRKCRIVRVNEVFASMTGVRLSRHLGRMLPEILPEPIAGRVEDAVRRVIETEAPVRDVELTGETGKLKWSWTWLASAYPVKTSQNQVRWVGVIVIDASERKRSEEALRRTEKLAATGRLAASIAHEINNPLEAITNLLFLMRTSCRLDDEAMSYLTTAEQELRRMSEITQQTLRFYRQSTLPGRATMTDILDSVLSLYQPRLSTLGIEVERNYDPAMNLYCFAGEVRQVIANLVSNAIDATSGGGRMVVSARRSRNWKEPGVEGVRFTVADTGTGMEDEVRARLFEAFFTTKGTTGTGLGLWVSREIIQKHRGIVHVRSRPVSAGGRSGSVFQVFFPDNQVLAPVAEQSEVLQ